MITFAVPGARHMITFAVPGAHHVIVPCNCVMCNNSSVQSDLSNCGFQVGELDAANIAS